MVNGSFDFRFCPRNLSLKQGNALLEFVNRQGVQILADQISQQIFCRARRKLIQVHICSVDRDAMDVNKKS